MPDTINGKGTIGDIGRRTDPPEGPEGLANVGGYVAAADRGENPLLDLDMHYQDDEVTDVDINEETLRLWAFVEEWTEVADSSVDTGANIVSTLLEEFDPDGRVFGPFGETCSRRFQSL